ncbi:MAG TPA: hypothetical protein VIK72_02830 [Clostridiaceae bacterium]
MQRQKINSFPCFCTALREVGFSMSGSNGEGIFSLCAYFSDNLVAHTGIKETDPWEWRIRGILECDDLAYGKLFFNKGGWITKEWYPYFMAIRREYRTFYEMYREGLMSNTAKNIYDLICHTPDLSLYEIKMMIGFDKSQKSEFEASITMLQMKMFITISGEKYKLSKVGKEYGWPVTTFRTTEDFFGEEMFDLSCELSQQEAIDKIKEQILILNPSADTKAMSKFIGISNRQKQQE